MAGGYPVPPLPGQQFAFTSRRELARGTTIVQERVEQVDEAVSAPTETDVTVRGGHPWLSSRRPYAASGSPS